LHRGRQGADDRHDHDDDAEVEEEVPTREFVFGDHIGHHRGRGDADKARRGGPDEGESRQIQHAVFGFRGAFDDGDTQIFIGVGVVRPVPAFRPSKGWELYSRMPRNEVRIIQIGKTNSERQ
jgi:hypothetical protein